MSITSYWKALVSNALRQLREQRNMDAVNVIKNANLRTELNGYGGWNSNIEFWDIIFELKYKDYVAVQAQKDKLEAELLETMERFHNDEYNQIANVLIQVKVEPFLDWQSITPETKESTIELIENERQLLIEIATGRSYKTPGTEDEYQVNHQKIVNIANLVGFEYPIKSKSLAEWWMEIKKIEGYAARRAHIYQLFSNVIEQLKESEDTPQIDFSKITDKSVIVKKAIEDAEIFIREGSYDSAFDRVHTAFHGYLEETLKKHAVDLKENESMTALFNKLHAYYENSIQPPEVGKRIKSILRSAGGIINSINELRNNNTIAHPNSELIQEREACLVIRFVNAIVDYIEDIEKEGL